MKSFQRRKFIGQIAAAGAAPFIPSFLLPEADLSWISKYKKSLISTNSISSLVKDEQFWYQIKTMYSSSPGILNLNNGGVSPQPLIVQEAHERYNKMCNEAPSYYMWRILDQGREPLRQRLADLAGVSNEEVSICRNASEALETVIFGLKLQRGDAVVLSKLDYPNMMNAWKQREMREGIVLKWVELELPRMNEQEIIEAFTAQMTPDVRIVHITHMINWNGQILPVRKIADKAHEINARVLVDGAHTFAHLQFAIPELGADFFGTSLHKWLCAPFGSGMLYVNKDQISSIYPLFANDKPESADIRKFESLGTRSFAIEQAIGQAIDFHYSIGSQLKQERLQYLKKYWTDAVTDHPKIRVNTDTDPAKSCALCIVKIDGMTPVELSDVLLNKYKIHTTAIEYYNVSGVRVTPHVYTVKSDLDRLISALRALADT